MSKPSGSELESLAQAQRWALHFHQTPLAVIEWDMNGRVRSWNPAAERMFGYAAAEAIGQSIIELIVPPKAEVREQVQHLAEGLTQQGLLSQAEHENRRKDGSLLRCRWFNTPLTNEAGQSLGVASMALDVTEIQQATQALMESEQRFHTLADYAYDWELWEDPGGAIRYCSPSCERITGYAPDAFTADPRLLERLMHPEDRGNWQAHRARVQAANGPEAAALMNGDELEYRLLRADGEVRWLGHLCRPIHDAAGHFRGHRSTNRDITLRKQAQQALRESEARNRGLISAIPDLIFLNRRNGDYLDLHASEPSLLLVPRESILQGNNKDFLPRPLAEEFLEAFGRALEGNEVQEVRYSLDLPLGERHFEARVAPCEGDTVITIVRDITERQQQEAALAELEAKHHQLQKAESLGLMAGSIAHLFNNKLQVVLGNLDLLSALPRGADPSRYLAMARLASEKAAAVSRQMLVYLGNTPTERTLLSLGELCTISLPLLQQALPGGVKLEWAGPEPGPVIQANAEQLQRVLTNLVTNAGEALEAAGGATAGCVRLRLSTCPVAALPTAHRFPVDWQPQGPDFACLEVADAGVGIPSADIEKLFDPFFSTKFTGRGLGLPVVLGIVQAHGGVLTVESEPGQGSVFRAYFPVSTEALPSRVEPAKAAPAAMGGGTLLLVDDDELLRDSACELIGLLGFTVLTAKDGVEALEVFRQHQAEIRCVLTDLTMPRLDGWGLLAALRQLDPNLPVILASGYDKAQVLAGNHSDRPQAFLSKPFDLQQLRDALGQALLTRSCAGH